MRKTGSGLRWQLTTHTVFPATIWVFGSMPVPALFGADGPTPYGLGLLLGIPMATSFVGLPSGFAMTRSTDQVRASRVEGPPVPVFLAVRGG